MIHFSTNKVRKVREGEKTTPRKISIGFYCFLLFPLVAQARFQSRKRLLFNIQELNNGAFLLLSRYPNRFDTNRHYITLETFETYINPQSEKEMKKKKKKNL